MNEKRDEKSGRKPPQLGETSIDLSGLPIVDLTRDQVNALVKPRRNWEEVAEQVARVYPTLAAELGLGKFDPAEAVLAPIALARELVPYEAWLEKALETVRETRLKAASDAWRGVLKVYRRANDVGIDDPRVAKAFRFVSDFLANETHGEATTRPTTATNVPGTPGPR